MAPDARPTDAAAARIRELGAFIREQRTTAKLSLRALAERADISNPYLSQIERGLRRPSADILQRVADGLRISAETLYVRAGMLEERGGGLDEAIATAPELTEEQRRALLEIYRAFVTEPTVDAPAQADPQPQEQS